jgi:hypothetical protein
MAGLRIPGYWVRGQYSNHRHVQNALQIQERNRSSIYEQTNKVNIARLGASKMVP